MTFFKKEKNITKEDLIETLKKVRNPIRKQDIYSAGMVKLATVCDNIAKVQVELTPQDEAIKDKIKVDIEEQLFPLGLKEFKIEWTTAHHEPPHEAASYVGVQIKHVIAVASGKGGVGKSTVAANLAVALSKMGAKTGLLDADIYGPSVPLLMQKVGVHPEGTPQNKMLPIEGYGLKLMSVGFIAEPGQAIIWRGPMIHKLLQEFFQKVEWGELDYLVIDLPPGTGDTQLSLSQLIPLAGAVVVTTPQDVALSDVEKCVSMFKRVNIPILGVVENMSYVQCKKGGEREEIFLRGGGEKAAKKGGCDFLGALPLKTSICEGGDRGTPFVYENEKSEESQSMLKIAQTVKEKLQQPQTTIKISRV